MEIIFDELNGGECKSYIFGLSKGRDEEGREVGGEYVIVDPLLKEAERYLKMIEEDGSALAAVIDTHTHADHLSGGTYLREKTGCDYIMHTSGRVKGDIKRVSHGDELLLGGVPVKVLHTPGHTKDSICLILPSLIITGDTLFLDEGGAGRTDLPGGDPSEHFESLEMIRGLPGELLVCPGHDYRSCNISDLKHQMEINPNLKIGDREEYLKYMSSLKLGPADWMVEVLKANVEATVDSRAVEIPCGAPACEAMGTADTASYREKGFSFIDPFECEEMMEEGEPILLDIREDYELTGPLGALDGITHIPLGSLGKGISDLKGLMGTGERDIVVICRIGQRAITGAEILTEGGFKKVHILEGGMVAWRHEFGTRNA